MKNKLVIAASIGNCVHVAGAVHFLDLAAAEGYETIFLGPAVSVEELIENILEYKPDIVSVGYRLTPENVIPLIKELKKFNRSLENKPTWVFGGTRPVSELVAKEDFFDKIFDGTDDIDDSIAFLRNTEVNLSEEKLEDSLVARMQQKFPYPLLRHHFGLPSFKDTVEGVKAIASAKVLDIISLGPDQNTQEYFFHPEKRDPLMDGAGGVPIRSQEEFRQLKAASQYGNYPLMRCYSGTADVFRMAEVLRAGINNAWAAIPLCWYNELDGRGKRDVDTSIAEAQRLIEWHAQQKIPVEINEAHHWSLRDAHDVITTVMSYVSAYNAKALGVEDYIAQFMFNVPSSLSFSMDLAKGYAQKALVEELEDDKFRIYRQTRTGLPFLSGDLDVAKGQLAASTYLQMALNPHIIHVVGYSEAEYAATVEVVVESCRIVRGVIRSVLHGGVNSAEDRAVLRRSNELIKEAKLLIAFIETVYADWSKDPLADSSVLADCIKRGILDAPHIVKNQRIRGILQTRVIQGKCVAYDSENKKILSEQERLQMLEKHGNLKGLQGVNEFLNQLQIKEKEYIHEKTT